MNNEAIFNDIVSIARQVFKEEKNLVLTKSTSSQDIFSWNSLSHVIFIEAIEKHFNVRFDLDAMLEMETIGDICSQVEKNISK